jgi:HSP20 family protein
MAREHESKHEQRPDEKQREREEKERRGGQGQGSGSTMTHEGPASERGAGGRQEEKRGGREVAQRERGESGLARPDSPFQMIRRFHDEMDRLFEDFGFGPRFLIPQFEGAEWWPEIEVAEREGKIVITADLPGLKPDDIEVDVNRGELTIKGERRNEHEEKDERYYHRERRYGAFVRTIPLPEGVDPEKVEASFKNGVLEVVVPAPAEEKEGGRKVEIRSQS